MVDDLYVKSEFRMFVLCDVPTHFKLMSMLHVGTFKCALCLRTCFTVGADIYSEFDYEF